MKGRRGADHLVRLDDIDVDHRLPDKGGQESGLVPGLGQLFKCVMVGGRQVLPTDGQDRKRRTLVVAAIVLTHVPGGDQPPCEPVNR